MNDPRTLAQAQHIAQKILAIRDKHARERPAMARYSVFIETPRGDVEQLPIEASALSCACRQFMRAWFSRTTTCTVVMRAPCGRRFRYADALAVAEGGQCLSR